MARVALRCSSERKKGGRPPCLEEARSDRQNASTTNGGGATAFRNRSGGGNGSEGGWRRSRRTRPRAVLSRRRCTGAVACLAGLLAGRTGVVVVVSADDLDAEEFTPRSFDGVGNNEAFTEWGAVGTTLLRSVAEADYADADYTPPGELDRPTAREVTTDVFLASPPAVSTKSALFIAWGQLLTYDLALTSDNSSEPFDVPCNEGEAGIDVWCPLGANSDPIPFYRSQAALSDDDGALAEETRSPVNQATAYIDLDFVYGRSEADAEDLRTMDGTGFMNITEKGLPYLNADGTWMIADQRSASFPVTLALHSVLLLEHNRCCVDIAPAMGYETGEELYEACRAWTIAVFQHITENDFIIRLLGGTIEDLAEEVESSSSYRRRRRRLQQTGVGAEEEQDGVELGLRDGEGIMPPRFSGSSTSQEGAEGERYSSEQRRRSLWSLTDYDESVNPGADTFTLTAGGAAFESAIPSTLRVVSEGYVATRYDNIELTKAVGGDNLASFFEGVELADVLRGAVLSPVFAVDTYYAEAISTSSPLFKLPVDAVQRGRDHGLPTYNEARLAFGLSAATSFLDVASSTSSSSSSSSSSSPALDANEEVAAILSDAYGGDVTTLDAITGGLAESTGASSGGFFGPLLHAAWQEQFYRTYYGDRFHHLHSREIEDASLTTISDLLNRTAGAKDVALSAFIAAGVTVCGADCIEIGVSEAELSDSYSIAWEVLDDGYMRMSLSAKGIGDAGMLGIGWGGLTMTDAQDYVICEVISAEEAECIDRQPTGGRTLPEPDDENSDLGFESVEIDGDWTTVTFLKPTAPLDDQDYDLATDVENQADTDVVYSFREGAGVGQHPNANRGASTVNFATGDVEIVCSEDNFVSLHGALMLIAWMILAPWGIYYVRYRKGEEIDFIWQYQWWEMHEEIMIVASEAVLPLGITAIFASGGGHNSEHAHWGYYMIAAVIAQVLTGWLRVKGLEGKNANFSNFHRLNKFFHIYAGRFAYLAGLVQCYRGLELVASDDQLIFSAGDGLDLQLGSFGYVYDYGFPAWFCLIALTFLYLEVRKQYRRYFKKGSAKLLGCVQIINEKHKGEAGASDDEDLPKEERLMPRTKDLPIYSVAELNDKVLNGQSWVLVDGAILDVADFAQRHPGGRRLILNALGTDVTQELLGEDLSVGHAMSFPPHVHTERAWVILRELVIGYIEEDDDEDDASGDSRSRSRSRGASAAEEGGEEETGRRPSEVSAADKTPLSKLRVAGQTVKFVAARGPLGGDSLAVKAQRLNGLATIPNHVPEAADTIVAPSSSHVAPKEMDGPRPRVPPKRSNSSSKRLLERFHVCPLLFRERMGALTPAGRGFLTTPRPVYRYIFLCPGQAQVLPQAITGVCYFNMRGQEKGHGVIQRSYNAFAVRVQDTNSVPATPGRAFGGLVQGADKGGGTLKVVPASETTHGVLCIEMRIRLYSDGAMSKLLDRLAQDTDNPAVQLQGPFVIQKLVPPPAHRNVVMIAAGTGINPMVQQIRDYLALPRGATQSSRSRLALLWQATSEADLYGSEEITAMQGKSGGLLEVTVLISGEHRKRNIPGAAFRKGAGKLLAKAGLVSPVMSSPADSVAAVSGRRQPQETSFASISENKAGLFESNRSSAGGSGREKGPGNDGSGKSILSGIGFRHKRALSNTSSVAGGVTRGKVSREVLEEVFGNALLADVEAAVKKEEALSATIRRRARSKSKSKKRRKRTASKAAEGEEEKDSGEESSDDEDDDDDTDTDDDDLFFDQLAGDGKTRGQLQVVVSGPSGFVFYVETILAEMGVLPSAIVLLD